MYICITNNNIANMNFFFVKNSWYFIVAEWPTGGEDKIKHNGATDLQASNFANLTLIFLFFYYYLKCKNTYNRVYRVKTRSKTLLDFEKWNAACC